MNTMKTCRTIEGLLKAIRKGEKAQLKHTSKSMVKNGYIIYQSNGTNLIVSNGVYDEIKNHLKQV